MSPSAGYAGGPTRGGFGLAGAASEAGLAPNPAPGQHVHPVDRDTPADIGTETSSSPDPPGPSTAPSGRGYSGEAEGSGDLGAVRLVRSVSSFSKSDGSSNPLYTEANRTAATASSS
jgi:hypothetical protein